MRDFSLFIKDILGCIERIEEYIGSMDYMEFIISSKDKDAVVRRLEIIGEASKHIPKEIKSKHRAIPWKNMIGMRDRITHAYFGLDYEIIWKIIKEELPRLRHEIKLILNEINNTE